MSTIEIEIPARADKNARQPPEASATYCIGVVERFVTA